MTVNEVTLVGRLGVDPEVKRTNSGAVYANLSVGTSERWRDKSSGERKEKTEWHKVVVWNEKIVEIVETYLRKGAQVFIRGKLQTRKWQAQDGSDRFTTEVVLTGFDCKLQMLGGRGDRDQGGGGRGEDGGNRGGGRSRADDLDDEIPF